jgi:hypothetical protein
LDAIVVIFFDSDSEHPFIPDRSYLFVRIDLSFCHIINNNTQINHNPQINHNTLITHNESDSNRHLNAMGASQPDPNLNGMGAFKTNRRLTQ